MDSLLVFSMEDFSKHFQIDLTPLGHGHDASVFRVMRQSNIYALKVLTATTMEHICNIYILIEIGPNPNVTQLLGHSDDFSCMLMEFMPFGNFYFVLELGPLSKPAAKTLFVQLAKTLQCLHEKGIVHGDIKPENMLISNQYRVKLCDFGFAKSSKTPQSRRTVGGSIGYIAPEIYQSQQLNLASCDIFSLGVVLFIMVNGCPPFQNNNPNVKDDWWHLIKNKHWDHYWGMFTQVDDGFKDVIQRILTNDSKTRISLPELLAHEWLGQGLASEQDLALEIKKRVDNVQKKKKN